MDKTLPGKEVSRRSSWRRFSVLLGTWFGAVNIAALLPLGGWSDVRSQWRNAALIAAVCGLFLVLSAYCYWNRGSLSGLQTSLLCLIFGCMFVYMGQELYTDMLFFQELRNRHGSANQREPNHPAGGNAGSTFEFAFGTHRTRRASADRSA